MLPKFNASRPYLRCSFGEHEHARHVGQAACILHYCVQGDGLMNNAYAGAPAGPLYTCWLSSGGILSIRPDRFEVGPESYLVADLTSATLTANPSVSPTPGTFT